MRPFNLTLLNKLWLWLCAERRAVEVFIGLLFLKGLTLWIPQAPVVGVQNAIFSRWLAEMYGVFGPWGKLLAGLGLLTLHFSWWMRAALAWLCLVLAARLSRLLEDWARLTWGARGFQGMVLLGGGMLIGGWLALARAGWIEANIIAWPGQAVRLPLHQWELPDSAGARWLWNSPVGLYLLPRDEGLGLEVRATDARDAALVLTTSGAAQPVLRLPFTAAQSDAVFALPEAGYVFRITELRSAAGTVLQFQAYREASGEFLTQTELQGDEVLRIGEVRLHFQRYVLRCFEAVYDPGAPWSLVGALWMCVGLIGCWLIRPSKTGESETLLETK